MLLLIYFINHEQQLLSHFFFLTLGSCCFYNNVFSARKHFVFGKTYGSQSPTTLSSKFIVSVTVCCLNLRHFMSFCPIELHRAKKMWNVTWPRAQKGLQHSSDTKPTGQTTTTNVLIWNGREIMFVSFCSMVSTSAAFTSQFTQRCADFYLRHLEAWTAHNKGNNNNKITTQKQ